MLTPGAIIAAQLAGPQSTDPRRHMMSEQPFTWGQGGRRMTPEDIARERRIAAQQMQMDYSPVASPWQGLARVADNISGALRSRDADKASRANADYSAQIVQSLLNPGASSGSGPPGAVQSPAPGGNPAALMQIIADPYAGADVKALAQMQLEQQQKIAMKQLEWENRPQPEIVQLANIANDPTQPAWRQKAAQDRITALNDPMQVIPGVNGGTYVGRASGIADAFGGGQSGGPKVGDVVDGHRFLGGNPNDQASWEPVSNDPPPISAAPSRVNEKDAMAKARADGDEYLRRLLEGK